MGFGRHHSLGPFARISVVCRFKSCGTYWQGEAEGALLAQVVLHVADCKFGALPLQLAEEHARRLAQQVAQHLRTGSCIVSASPSGTCVLGQRREARNEVLIALLVVQFSKYETAPRAWLLSRSTPCKGRENCATMQ